MDNRCEGREDVEDSECLPLICIRPLHQQIVDLYPELVSHLPRGNEISGWAMVVTSPTHRGYLHPNR